MSFEQYATPIIVGANGVSTPLQRLPISGADSTYDEGFIQDLAFKHPSCLPVTEIDRAFEGLIPVCTELNTPAGPLDILYVTPKGRLVVVEAKLWRNPEARRKVVGQILDYAKELSRWDYEDLQREVSRSTKRKGNVLFDLVAELYPETNEADFVDEVTRSLSQGRFLLLILGDGIREGVGAIAQFLEEVGGLEFTFGLVELAIYRRENNELLLQPRVLAKTTVFKRTVISLKEGQLTIDDSPEEVEKIQTLSPLEQFYSRFWPDFFSDFTLDDPSQPLPKSVGKIGRIFFRMPPSGQGWVSAYFSQKDNEIGVYLNFTRGSFADAAFGQLLLERDAIDEELGVNVVWYTPEDDLHSVAITRKFSDLTADENQKEIKEFFADNINRFVNVFRPRLARIAEDV